MWTDMPDTWTLYEGTPSGRDVLQCPKCGGVVIVYHDADDWLFGARRQCGRRCKNAEMRLARRQYWNNPSDPPRKD